MCESCLNYFDLTFSLSLLFFFIFFILYVHTLALLYYIFNCFTRIKQHMRAVVVQHLYDLLLPVHTVAGHHTAEQSRI